jgi:TonB family protein
MASFLQTARRFCQRLGIVLFCVFGLLPAFAEAIGEEQHLPELSAKQASRLLLSQVPPEYPVLAKVNYIQGQVRVRLTVDTEGRVANAHVLSGNPLLAAAVLNSVDAWHYRPYVARGGSGPTAFETRLEVNFSLRMSHMDLVPTQAESDFRRQVKPPEVLAGSGPSVTTDASVRLRLLVNADGKVIDSQILKGIPSLLEKATRAITRWSFRPARWGTLAVPWYLDVDVPVDHANVQAGVGLPHEVVGPGTE